MVVTLRSERELDDSKEVKRRAEIEIERKDTKIEKYPTSVKMNQEERNVDSTQKNQEQEEIVPGKVISPNNPLIYTPPLPFPQRFRKAKMDEQFTKFLNVFKKLEINIPFVDALVIRATVDVLESTIFIS